MVFESRGRGEDTDKINLVLGIVARASPQWKALYKHHPIIERMFGSMKRMRLLDKFQYLRQHKIKTHLSLVFVGNDVPGDDAG